MSISSDSVLDASSLSLTYIHRGWTQSIFQATANAISNNFTFTSFAALWVFFYVGRILYRLYFHPLARYPGPRTRAVSNLPRFFTRLAGYDVSTSTVLHAKYGDVVRTAPNELSFSTPGAWKDIYGTGQAGMQIPKSESFYNPDNNTTPSLLFANDSTHARLRRIVSSAFSASALRDQEPIMTKYFNLLVTKLSEHAVNGTPVDVTAFYNFTAFDILGDLCFGEPFGALEHASYHPWMSTIFANVRAFATLQAGKTYLWMDLLLRALLAWVPAAAAARHDHVQFTRKRVERRIASKTARNDIMSYVLRSNYDAQRNTGMSHDEICGSMDILMIAGSETTATLLSGATWLLLQNPDCLAKLTAEVRNRFASTYDITVTAAMQLPYLRAVLEESLRIYPPVPALMPHITATETIIDGKVIPAGTHVGIPQWAMFHSSKYFTNPERFAPERWLGTEEFKNDIREVFQPFSVGPRNCIGRNLAYAEMTSILARVVHAFDLQLHNSGNGSSSASTTKDKDKRPKSWMEQRCFVLWQKQPLMVKLTPAVTSQITAGTIAAPFRRDSVMS